MRYDGHNLGTIASPFFRISLSPSVAILLVCQSPRDRKVEATVFAKTDAVTLQSFVTQNFEGGSTVSHTNGIESFWAMLKRGFKGTYHKMSVKPLSRYVIDFAGRHNVRDLDILVQMVTLARGLEGRRLRYSDLFPHHG